MADNFTHARWAPTPGDPNFWDEDPHPGLPAEPEAGGVPQTIAVDGAAIDLHELLAAVSVICRGWAIERERDEADRVTLAPGERDPADIVANGMRLLEGAIPEGFAFSVPGICRACGCTAENACWDDEHGPCAWIEPDLCSACATEPEHHG